MTISLDKFSELPYTIGSVSERNPNERKIMAENIDRVIDIDDDVAISEAIDAIMEMEEAEDELFDHFANFEV